MVEDSVADSQCGLGLVEFVWIYCFVFINWWRRPLSIVARFLSYLLTSARHMTLCQGRCFGVLCGNMVSYVDLLHSFHDRMVATVPVSGEEPPPFEVRNGLHQVAPLFFFVF